MKIVTYSAIVRMAALLGLLVVAVGLAWFSMIRMPLKSYRGPWSPLSADETNLRDALKRNVEQLADKIGERNVFAQTSYVAAADFIESAFSQSGYTVKRYPYQAEKETCWNIELEMPGRQRAKEIIVIGAHYDSVWGCAGANDNASGVAALIELARAFAKGGPQERTLRFVAFANEEPPFFQTDLMGSYVYAKLCKQRGDNITAMLSLETVGCYSDKPGSQKYPFPLSLFYPSRGNFIAFVGDTSSKGLVHRCIASFRRHTKFPSEGAALPRAITGIDWSDHWAFWQAGYPALMVTDTAPFRYPHYHTAQDTPDKLAYDQMARVVAGLEKVIQDLATD